MIKFGTIRRVSHFHFVKCLLSEMPRPEQIKRQMVFRLICRFIIDVRITFFSTG